MKIYLDVCCLNRLFDDQQQLRVATEAAAVERLLDLAAAGSLADYSSEMAQVEIERMPDADRRRKVAMLLPDKRRIMPLSPALLDAAEQLQKGGFGLADAVHLAAAAQWKVDAFLSVDDRLLRAAKRNAGRLPFRVLNPVVLLQELDDAIDG
ncbi:MAG: PIN domain-containing protein [Phycisphaeraceae bacterium]